MRLALALCALLAGCSEAGPPPPDTASTAGPESSPATAEAAPQGPFAPRDDCAHDPAAAAFTAELRQVVAARDVERLLAMTDPQVLLDFGGGAGHAELRQRLGNPDYALWDELARIMPLGCAIDPTGNVVMPWYFAQEVEGDPFEIMLVAGNDRAVRAEPQADAPQVANVSWDIVDLAYEQDGRGQGWPPDTGWMRVRTRGPSPVTGFMAAGDLRSVVDYRLLAGQGEGGFRMTVLVAGD